jgi:hypothetical protein
VLPVFLGNLGVELAKFGLLVLGKAWKRLKWIIERCRLREPNAAVFKHIYSFSRPAILDLRAISQTVDLTRIAGKQAAIVLNAVPARGSLTNEAIEAVASYGVAVSATQLGQRAAYVHCLTAGLTAQEFEPDGKAAAEIKNLFHWVMKQLGVDHEQQETELVGSIA